MAHTLAQKQKISCFLYSLEIPLLSLPVLLHHPGEKGVTHHGSRHAVDSDHVPGRLLLELQEGDEVRPHHPHIVHQDTNVNAHLLQLLDTVMGSLNYTEGMSQNYSVGHPSRQLIKKDGVV